MTGGLTHADMKTFFCEAWQTPNQLLRAVLCDIQVLEYLAGCRTLGLINKAITGPLWRILESPDISILDMNEYMQMLIAHLQGFANTDEGHFLLSPTL